MMVADPLLVSAVNTSERKRNTLTVVCDMLLHGVL